MSLGTKVRPRRAGLALPLVIMVSMVILGLIMAGLAFSSQNVLFMASFHRREAARYAAEAGVYRTLARLEQEPTFSGVLEENLPNSEASFQAEVVSNDLAGPTGLATIRSRGKVGRFSSRVEATISRSGESFDALGADGLIRTEGNVFANGVRSMANPEAERVRVHSNSAADRALDGTGRFMVRGLVSAVGGIADFIEAASKRAGAGRNTLGQMDKAKLLEGTFATGSVPADNTVGANLRVAGDTTIDGSLRLQNGATLHVQDGSLTVKGGVSGDGAVVADKTLKIRGSSELDPSNTRGVTLYGEEGVEIAHPEATETADGYDVEFDAVADFFARMPEDARYVLAESLPPDAPTGADFFEWYRTESLDPSASFQAWRDGAGPGAPGLSPEMRDWLDSSGPIVNDLKAWAAENGTP